MSTTTRGYAPASRMVHAADAATAQSAESATSSISMADVLADHLHGTGMPVSKNVRPDTPHLATPAPLGLLSWTAYVPTPEQCSWLDVLRASQTARGIAKPAQRPITTSEQPPTARSASARGSDTPLGVHRQRFYPDQWRRAVQPRLDNLLKQHDQQLQWIGWDRSLPRLYLSVDHLNRTLLDLVQGVVQRVVPRGKRDAAMSLRVAWQSGATQSLVMVLEHPQLELSPLAIAAINAPLELLTSNSEHGPPESSQEFLRVRRLVASLGGSLSASECRGGGSLFRISLPIDERLTLVRAWLEQASRAYKSSMPTVATTIETMPVSLFIVGRRQMESISALNAADARLQSLAGSADFVYRVGRGRWLWLTSNADLPGFVKSQAWQSQLVRRWRCQARSGRPGEQESAARIGVAQAIAADINRLMGQRVPPLDLLTSSGARARRVRIDATKAVDAVRPRDRSRHVSAAALSSELNRQRRWRYPI